MDVSAVKVRRCKLGALSVSKRRDSSKEGGLHAAAETVEGMKNISMEAWETQSAIRDATMKEL
jgi:hypothetical protein